MAVIAAVSMVMVLLAAAFAVDLGVQRVARRDMQALADSVSIDVSRLLDGRTVAAIKSGAGASSTLATVLDNSVRRNLDSALGDAPATCAGGGTRSSVTQSCVRAYLVTLDGTSKTYQTSNGTPVETPSTDQPDGVVVVASTDVKFAFSSVVGITDGGATRSSVAANTKSACFRLGSYAAAVRSGSSTLLAPLNTLLGLNLTAVGYNGLATAGVSIASLAATGQVGTVDQLLTGQTSVPALANAAITVLQGQSPQNQAAITALGAVAAGSAGVPSVQLGSVVGISPSNTAALTTSLNVLDLLAGSIGIAKGSSAVDASGLTAGIPGLGTATVNTLRAIERPSLACGTATTAPVLATCASSSSRPLPIGCAQNSQVRGAAEFPFTLANTPVGSTFFKVSSSGVKLNLDVGNGAGVLSTPDPECGAGTLTSPDRETVALTTSAATGSLTTSLHLETNALDLGIVLGKVVVKVDVDLTTSLTPSTASATAALANPPNQDTPVSGGPDVRLAALGTQPTVTLTVTTAGGLPIIGATLGLVTTALNTLFGITAASATTALNAVVSGPVNALVTSLNNLLLGPLATLLGLDVAGADVYMVGRPTCQNPLLVG